MAQSSEDSSSTAIGHGSGVPEVSDGTASDKEYRDLVTQLTRLVVIATNEQMRVDLDENDNDAYLSKAVGEIKACREEVGKVLDVIVEEAVKNVNRLHKENLAKIKHSREKCQSVLSDVKPITTELEEKAYGSKNSRLFEEMKLTRHRMPAFEKEIQDVTDSKITRFTFDKDEKMKKLKSTLSATWSLSVRQDNDTNSKARYVKEIVVRSAEDKHDCCITGITVLAGDRVVVTDLENTAVKLIDVKLNKVKSRLSLSSDPYDVTRTKSDQVAVAIGNKQKIEIITVSDVLTRSHTIDVPGRGFTSLCFTGDMFILVYSMAREIKTVDMNGRVLSTVYTDTDADPLFKYPMYIALSRCQEVVYVTDRDASTVTTMTLKGQIISVYKHGLLKSSRRVTVGRDGHIYVCSGTHTVHQLSVTGEQGHVLLDKPRGVAKWPWAIGYDEEQERLYISSGSKAPKYSNYIRMFQLD